MNRTGRFTQTIKTVSRYAQNIAVPRVLDTETIERCQCRQAVFALAITSDGAGTTGNCREHRDPVANRLVAGEIEVATNLPTRYGQTASIIGVAL